MSGQFLLFPRFIEILVLNANSVDQDQMLHSAVSDLGPLCLPVFPLLDARHKWVNCEVQHICITTLKMSSKIVPDVSLNFLKIFFKDDRAIHFI